MNIRSDIFASQAARLRVKTSWQILPVSLCYWEFGIHPSDPKTGPAFWGSFDWQCVLSLLLVNIYPLWAGQYVSVSERVCLPMTDGVTLAPTPPKHTGPSSGQWFPLMAPSGEGAGRNEQEKEGQKEGRKSIDFLKGGSGEDMGLWGSWGDKGDDGPPGTRLKWSSPPIISCSILRSSRRHVEGVRTPVTDDRTRGHSRSWWMGSRHHGITALHHHRAAEKTKDPPLLRDGCINRMGFFFHGVIFVQKCWASAA